MFPPDRRPLLGLLLCLSLACAGRGGNSGCTAVKPLPDGRFAGVKNDNAINARLSPQGINYLNANWQTLIESFAPGQRVEIPLRCTEVGKGRGDSFIRFADQGTPGCTSQACGYADKKCDTNPSSPTYDAPRNVAITVTGFNLLPRAPDTIQGSLLLNIETGPILVEAFCATCTVEYSGKASPDNIAVNKFQANVKFTVDQKWDRLATFEIVGLDGTQVCGTNGAPAAPMCLSTDDLLIRSVPGSGLCSDLACTGADWFKDVMLKTLSPILQNLIRNLINKQSCEQCGSGKPPCPNLSSTATSSCAFDICLDDQTNFCVPRFLGVEGRVSVADFLGRFGAPVGANLDLSVAVGSDAKVDSGLSFGTRVGLQRTATHACVPPASPPSAPLAPPPDFDAGLTFGYHAAVGLSGAFVNDAMFHAQQSGALCLNLTHATVGSLSTGLFKTFLPSLGRLASRDGRDAPMMVVLRPQRPPQLSLGEGTYDPTTKKPVKPLVRFTMPQLAIDFFAQLDDRFVRLFSLTADVTLPLSIIFEGCSAISPAIGDFKGLVTNLKTADSELLAENPAVLIDLVPAVIGVAEPMVASALKPFVLPQFGNFKLKVATARGVGPIPGTDNFHHVGLYGELVHASAPCVRTAAAPPVRVASSRMPAPEAMRATGAQSLPWPVAVIEVGAPPGAEVAYRVGDGLWSTFSPVGDGRLEVSHPAFLIQGHHRIQVRTRSGDEVSEPAQVPFRVDWEPPEISILEEAGGDRVRVQARDVISGADELSYSFRTEGGAWQRLDPSSPLDVSAGGDVEVRVTDGAGNSAVRSVRGLTTALRPEAQEAAQAAQTGCASAGAPLAPWAALLALLALRPRRRVF